MSGTMRHHLLPVSCIMSRWLIRNKHTMSSIFRPIFHRHTKQTEKGSNKTNSKSYQLLVENGLIRQSSTSGAFYFLPLGLKSLNKLITIIDHFLDQENCQKVQLPTLTSTNLWKTSGRIDSWASEVMKVTDRNAREFILSPTHEEAICELVSSQALSYHQLPLRLYQITDKFRDEKRPRAGLLRGRQFVMKDLYTFDVSEDAARTTYDTICSVYEKLFKYLEVKTCKALGTTGSIGGSLSHEYHLLSDVGEDTLAMCQDCGVSFNEEVLQSANVVSAVQGGSSVTSGENICPSCGSSQQMSKSKSIEIAHAFLLGTKYSEPLKTNYINASGQISCTQMGCYGIGVTRMLAAVIEIMCEPEEIRWPLPLAPYIVTIIPPKVGSKEERVGAPLAEKLNKTLSGILPNEILVDDRVDLTIGKRFLESRRLGIPYILILGKQVNDPIPDIEVINVMTGEVKPMRENAVANYFYDIKSQLQQMM